MSRLGGHNAGSQGDGSEEVRDYSHAVPVGALRDNDAPHINRCNCPDLLLGIDDRVCGMAVQQWSEGYPRDIRDRC